MATAWRDKLFSVTSGDFESLALEAFQLQYAENEVYRRYTDALNIDPLKVRSLKQVPFLPIRFFRSHTVITGSFEPALVFESSGTTGSVSSRHFVRDTSLYEESFTRCFELFYGRPEKWTIIGLLPSYLERPGSSLVYMVEKLIRLSGKPESGFYLNEDEKLLAVLQELDRQQKPTLLLGVTYALLDLAARSSLNLPHILMMETGGMKGRREELVRTEVHARLRSAFGLRQIHSEYGMTELLSQAYALSDGLFQTPSWMKVMVREEDDPFIINHFGSGALNIIDLANIHSCAFVATDDAGRIHADGRFEVLGRLDGSDLRGCSLLAL